MNRINPRTGNPISCMNCIHLHETLGTCNAFPEEIPIEILSGDFQHDVPYVGDNSILFQDYQEPSNKIKENKFDAYAEIIDIIHAELDFDSEPISELVSVPKIDSLGDIIGKFRIDSDIYNYYISKANIHIERYSLSRSDSFVAGYYLGDLAPHLNRGDLEEIIAESIPRLDSEIRCIKGIKCGGRCLPPGNKCRISMTHPTRQKLKKTRAKMSTPLVAAGAATAGLVSAAVGGAVGGVAATGAINKASQEKNSSIATKINKIENFVDDQIQKEQVLAAEREAAAKNIGGVRDVIAGAVEGGLPGLVVGGPIGGAVGAAAGAVSEIAKIGARKIRQTKSIPSEIGATILEAGGDTISSLKSASENMNGLSASEAIGKTKETLKSNAPKVYSRSASKYLGSKIR